MRYGSENGYLPSSDIFGLLTESINTSPCQNLTKPDRLISTSWSTILRETLRIAPGSGANEQAIWLHLTTYPEVNSQPARLNFSTGGFKVSCKHLGTSQSTLRKTLLRVQATLCVKCLRDGLTVAAAFTGAPIAFQKVSESPRRIALPGLPIPYQPYPLPFGHKEPQCVVGGWEIYAYTATTNSEMPHHLLNCARSEKP